MKKVNVDELLDRICDLELSVLRMKEILENELFNRVIPLCLEEIKSLNINPETYTAP
jgi:hypothetical protein